ncbi:uncharacterized protein DUF2125 [Palleronia aestuarii]|uniref:Uncharacterized protein DUF2125 n=1 Tax=Palleronia aestuarii TaxID=568105 RepID=A0A2W7NA55_9RHOB|nr:DUF2125 domain-containing protein [Palleronia aestuarii]PZX16523.1 uncharacterized protein DUF2125 [Palleronia aestuarii]
MFRTAPITALLAAGLALPATAEITADEVWQSWQDASSPGVRIDAASETREGDVLRLEGVTARFGERGAENTALIDWVELADQDDGTVRVSSAPLYRLRMEQVATENVEGTVVEGSLRHDGAVTTIAREDEVFTYETQAPEIVVLVEDIPSSDTGATTDATMTLTDLTLHTRDAVQDATSRTEIDASSVALDIQGEEPDTTYSLTARFEGFEGTTVDLLGALARRDAADAPMAPEFSAEMSHQGSSTRLDMSSLDGDSRIETQSGSGQIGITSADGMGRYRAESDAVTLSVSGPQVPVSDLSAEIDRVALSLGMPLVPTEEPKDFDVSYDLTGVTVSEQVWNLVDPTGALPRDPATLAIEATGQSRLTRSLANTPEVGGADQIVALTSLDIDRILLDAVGLVLTGDGSLDFDDGPGQLEPEGEIALRLEGGNGLLDTLLEAGLFPPGQILAMRTGLGMFSRPGEGEDVVESTIRFLGDGGIEVNGTRIR